MPNDLLSLKREFQKLFRQQDKVVLADEVALFIAACGCQGLRIRPAGLRTGVLNAHGEQLVNLLLEACEHYAIAPSLGYVRMVLGSRDLIDSLYIVAPCNTCQREIEESQGVAPIAVFYRQEAANHAA